MKRLFFIFFCSGIVANIFCQNIIKQNIYYENLNHYNPATTFSDTTYNYYATFYTKYKILTSNSYSEKPYDFDVSFQGRIQQRKGHYTAGYTYDGYSFFNRHLLYGGYGYKWQIKEHSLSIGAKIILNFDAVYWDKLSVSHYTGQQLFVMPDIDFGISYRWKGLNLGFSVKNLLALGERVDKQVLLHSRRTFLINLSYNTHFSSVTIAPYMLFSYDSEINLDIGIFTRLFDYGKISYLFRGKDFRHIFILGGELPCGFCIDVGFDFSTIARDKNLDIRLGYKF